MPEMTDLQSVSSYSETHIHLENELCPACGQPLSRAKAQEIRKRLEAEEAQHAAEFATREATIREEAMQTANAALEKRLQEQREALEKAGTESINAERAKFFAEKIKLEEKLQDLTRQLQNKTAAELGEGAETNLFEELKREFPGDTIDRVGKGVAGADIVHKVVLNGKICGKLVYDSKNRNRWLNDYVTKLRRD